MSKRQRLPNRRFSETFTIEAHGMPYVATFSRFDDLRVAELFLSNHKSGSAADVSARDAAVVCSLALQHGVPLETIRRALIRNSNGIASGPLGVALDAIATIDEESNS